jgi:hypothetical protein
LIPFQVQIAIKDETEESEAQVISDTLYKSGRLFTDTVADWMMDSFVVKTTNDMIPQLVVNNYTSFDSIALEKVEDSTSQGTIEGQELSLVQLSFEGVSLWERQGTGTPPVEPEIVELIQRATFLEDRSLKVALQTTINNLLFDLGINSIDGVQPILIMEVRAYITPPGSPPSGDASTTNKNLEIIIIVAIVVAVLAFALLIFAVVWAWRSDRKGGDDKQPPPPSSSRTSSRKERKSKAKAEATNAKKSGRKIGVTSPTKNNSSAYNVAPEEPSVEQASSYDLPHNMSDGSYPRVIGKSGNAGGGSATGVGGAYTNDSVVSEDISSSLSAYYKSGMAGSSSKAGSSSAGGGGGARNFNDAASMSSMDSYGYSLDGYAPSLGPTQGGYPPGPMQAARDAPMPVDGAITDIRKLQDEESIADYSDV